MAEINQEHITLTEEQKRLIKEKFAEKSADILAFFEKIKQHKQQAQTDSSTTTKETEEIKKFINDLTSEVVTVTETKNEIAHEIEEVSDFDLDLKQSSAAILQEETTLSLPEAGDVSAISQNIDIQQRVVVTDTSGKPVLENGKPKTNLVKYEPQHFSVFNNKNVIFSVTQRSQGVNTAPSQVAYVTRANEYSTPVAHLSVEYIDNLINSSDSPNKEEILAQFAAKKVGDFYVVDVDVASLDSEFNGNIQIKLTDKTSYSIKFGAFGAHLGVNGEHISNEGFPKEIGKEGRFPLDIAVSSYYMTMVDNKHFTLGKNLLQEQSKTLSPEDLFKNSAWSNFIVATLRSQQIQYPDKSFGITLQNPKMECVSVCLPHKNGQEVENQHVEFRVVENSKGKPVCQAYLHLKRDSVTGHSGYLKPKFYTIDSCAIVRDDENNYFLQMNAVDGKFSQKVHIPIDKDLTLDGIKAIMHLDENLFKNSEVIAVRDNISPIKGEKYNNLPVYNVDPSYKSTIIDTKVARLYVEGQQDVSVHAESTTTTTTTTTTTKHNEEIQKIVSKAVEEQVHTTIDSIYSEADISAIAGQFTEKTLEQIIEEVTTTTVDSDRTHIITGGNDGHDGEDGEDGRDGRPGQDGTDGKPGQDGTDGKPGQNGTDGKPGQNGTDGSGNGNGEETNTDQKKKDDEKKKEKPIQKKKEDGKSALATVRAPFKWLKKHLLDQEWFAGLSFFILLIGAIIPPLAIIGATMLGAWVAKKVDLVDDWSKFLDNVEKYRSLSKEEKIERRKEHKKDKLQKKYNKKQRGKLAEYIQDVEAKQNSLNTLNKQTPALKKQAQQLFEKERIKLFQGKVNQFLDSIASQVRGVETDIKDIKKLVEEQQNLLALDTQIQTRDSILSKFGGSVQELHTSGTQNDINQWRQAQDAITTSQKRLGINNPAELTERIHSIETQLSSTCHDQNPNEYIQKQSETIASLKKYQQSIAAYSLAQQIPDKFPGPTEPAILDESSSGVMSEINQTIESISAGTDVPKQQYDETISTLNSNLTLSESNLKRAKQALIDAQQSIKGKNDPISIALQEKLDEIEKEAQTKLDKIAKKQAELEEKRKKAEKRKQARQARKGLASIEDMVDYKLDPPASEQQPSEDEEIDPVTGKPKVGKGPKGTPSTGAQVGGNDGGGADLGGNGK